MVGVPKALMTEPEIRMQTRHPNALTEITSFQDICKGKRVVVFLDYDGRLVVAFASVFAACGAT